MPVGKSDEAAVGLQVEGLLEGAFVGSEEEGSILG